jgi:fatty acid synthase subunit alpha
LRLNADYFKPWFSMKKDGWVVEHLGDMTYEETLLRLVRLMYVTHENRWLDLSLRNLVGDWLRHVEERFTGVNGSGPKASKLQSYSSLDKPFTFVTSFFEKYPLATEQLLAHEDKSYCYASIPILASCASLMLLTYHICTTGPFLPSTGLTSDFAAI